MPSVEPKVQFLAGNIWVHRQETLYPLLHPPHHIPSWKVVFILLVSGQVFSPCFFPQAPSVLLRQLLLPPPPCSLSTSLIPFASLQPISSPSPPSLPLRLPPIPLVPLQALQDGLALLPVPPIYAKFPAIFSQFQGLPILANVLVQLQVVRLLHAPRLPAPPIALSNTTLTFPVLPLLFTIFLIILFPVLKHELALLLKGLHPLNLPFSFSSSFSS